MKFKKNWQCELKKGKSSKNSPVSTEDKSPFLNYDYEEVPFLPYESYEDYYSSVVPETHSGKFWLYPIKSVCHLQVLSVLIIQILEYSLFFASVFGMINLYSWDFFKTNTDNQLISNKIILLRAKPGVTFKQFFLLCEGSCM